VKVLVTFALANEFGPWRRLRHFDDVSSDAGNRTCAAEIGLADVRVVLTGAGHFAAQRSVEKAFEDVPDVCIVSGLSGSLKSDYRVGDVLAARWVSDAKGVKLLHCDPELVTDADSCGARVVERFLVSEQVVATAKEKRSLGASGDAVDMESIYILGAAAHRGIRALTIRAISDGVESDLPLDFDGVFTVRGTVSVPKVIGQLVRRPARLGGLLQLARDSKHAATELARFLDKYIQHLADGPPTQMANTEALAV